MCPLYEGLPAVIYSGLWTLRIFRKLGKIFPKSVKIVILLTDSPPAFLVNIDREDFNIEILENVNDFKDLDNILLKYYIKEQ
jgi:lipid A disaccharide synthetase